MRSPPPSSRFSPRTRCAGYLQRYGKLAHIPKAKRRFHALRHAIAVHLLDAGAGVAFVQDRLGHANIQNTMVHMRYTTITRDAQTRHLFASPRVV
jgi:site-specific recombinase XerD